MTHDSAKDKAVIKIINSSDTDNFFCIMTPILNL